MKILSDYDIKQYKNKQNKNKQTNQLTKSIKTMRKLLVLALAAFAFAACSEKGEEGTQTLQKGELEHSYLTITLAADDMGTRAEDPVYDEGLPHERKVKSAYVFFFNEKGEPFTVTWDSLNSGRNWIELDLDLTGKTGSVSDISDQVVVINNYKGEYPDKILAILNWTPEKPSYKLSDLQANVAELGNETNGFVMSNSVYSNENADTDKAVVDAVPLTANNIGKMKPDGATPSNAVEPVILHVERIAAKVRYTAQGDTTTGIEGLYDINAEDVDGNKIYAKVEGFELFNDHEKSYLVKRIDPKWTSTDLGFAWNNPAWFRSYWAESIDSAFPSNNFAWSHDDIDRSAANNYTYLGENTPSDSEAKNRTKVIVKATLGKVDGNNFEAVEIANWFGKNYIGEENLLKEVANMLNGLYFYSTDGTNFTGIEPEDIMCMQRGGDKEAYEVYYILSDKPNVGKAKKWYKYENGTYNPITVEKLNDELANVQSALIYNDGMTYYWLDIKHLGKEGKRAEFGVVRNHIYDVNISKISGFGTPIYDPNQEFVVPEKPESVASYVYAQINILSWRIVKNDYEI